MLLIEILNGRLMNEKQTFIFLIHSLFEQKNYGPGWVDGWMGGRAGLRIACSNQKVAFWKSRQLYSI